MTTQPNTVDVDFWKKFSFRESYDMCLEDAVKSLTLGENAKVQLISHHPARWQLVKAKTKEPAVLSWAGVYAGGFDMDTGNFVPENEKIPPSVPEARAQRAVNWKCSWTQSINMSNDRSLYEIQEVLETHASSIGTFNPDNRPRREFQNGSDLEGSKRYSMQVPMFLRRSDKPQTLAELHKSEKMTFHPWIQNARKGPYFPSPHKPTILELKDGCLHDIHRCKPPYLQEGDVVWFSVRIAVVINSNNWWTEMTPVEMIRVGTLPETMDAMTSIPIDPDLRRPLLAGQRFIKLPSTSDLYLVPLGQLLSAKSNHLLVSTADFLSKKPANSHPEDPNAMDTEEDLSKVGDKRRANDQEGSIHRKRQEVQSPRDASPLSDWPSTDDEKRQVPVDGPTATTTSGKGKGRGGPPRRRGRQAQAH